LAAALSHTRPQQCEAQRDQNNKDRANQRKHGNKVDVV